MLGVLIAKFSTSLLNHDC